MRAAFDSWFEFDTAFARRYLNCMKTTISTKGQIVLPTQLRRRDRIRAGQEFSIERIDTGRYLLEKIAETDNDGLVDWLLACPEKGWFQPVPSESTASLLTDGL